MAKKFIDRNKNFSNIISDSTNYSKLADIFSENEYLNYVINAAEIGTYKWNIQNDETEYNDRWFEMLGYTKDELSPIGENTFRNLVHPEDLIKSDLILKKHFDKEIPIYSCEIRMKHKDGTYRWIEDKGKVVCWTEDGRPLLMYGIHIDITEKKKIENELIESQQLFQNITESNLISICLIQNNKFIYVNPFFTSITGYMVYEILQKDIFYIFDEKHHKQVESLINKVNNGENVFFISKIKRKNKQERRWIYATLSKLYINSKESMLLSFNDISELKKVEEELKNIIEAANIGTWIWDVKTGKTIFNETWANLLGYELKELEPTNLNTFKEFIHPEDMKKVYEKLEKHFNGETKFYEVEIRMKHKNGSWIWVLDKGKTIEWDEQGKPLLVFGIHVDITNIKEIEKQLIEKNRFLELILNTIPSRVFWKDKNLNYRGCNILFAKDIGLENPNDILGKSDFDINPKQYAEIYRDEDKSILKTLKPIYNIIQEAPIPGGMKIWSKKHKVPILDENNNVIGILGTYENITDLKEKEKQLVEEKEKLDTLIQSIIDAVILIDKEKNIIFLNKYAQNLTGYTEEEALGKKLEEIFHIFDEKNLIQNENLVERIFESKQFIKSNENILLENKYGNRIFIEYTITPVFDASNNVIQAVIVFRDISEKIKLFNEILKTSKLESLSLLSSGIAHDFNNLLGGIYGFINLALQDSSINLETRENLLMAINTLKRAKSLSNQLLTFSKGGEPILSCGYINDIIIKTVNFALSGSSIEAFIDIDKDLKPVLCDKNMISQVIENLVINARQAMPHGGKIYVKACNIKLDENFILSKITKDKNNNEFDYKELENKEYIKISIKDEGIGIEPENLKYIFDPFFTTKKEGSGLGLPMSYSIIKKHKGFIDVNSRLNEGSEFIVYLPCIENINDLNLENNKSQLNKDNNNEKNIELKNNKIKKILVLDDEIAILKSISKYLTKKGFIVDEATSGEEALELYYKSMDANDKYDLLILDLTIQGGLGGKEVIEKIRQQDKEILAIVSSGYSDDAILSNPEKYGFNIAIQKPFLLEELYNIILSLQKNN